MLVARQLFASRGYAATSNRLIAEEAGLTTGAIYHYFDRKLDIFAVVYQETQWLVYERFAKAIEPATTFVDRLRAILETAHDMNNEDPSIARFLGSCRVDAARDSVIASAVRDVGGSRRITFFDDLIDFGIATGEVDPNEREVVSALLQTITVGLVDAVSGDRARHRRAVDGIMMLVEGKLLHPTVE
jgi:AcrR family transcriptional regulator